MWRRMLLTTGRWIQNKSLQNASEKDLLLNGPFYSGPRDSGSFFTLHATSTRPQIFIQTPAPESKS